MGQRDFYDEVEAMNTSLAKEMLAKNNFFGVVLPSNISPGVFVHVAGDNNDINEDTFDGKSTNHTTTLVLFQRGQFGPATKPGVYADLTKRKLSLQSIEIYQSSRQYSAYGKWPTVTSFSGKIQAVSLKYTERLH